LDTPSHKLQLATNNFDQGLIWAGIIQHGMSAPIFQNIQEDTTLLCTKWGSLFPSPLGISILIILIDKTGTSFFYKLRTKNNEELTM